MLKLITPPTIEPVTLTELKNQLRLNTSANEFEIEQSIGPGLHEEGTITGEAINVATSEATRIVNAGSVPGSITITWQESLDNSTWTDIDEDTSEINSNEVTLLPYLGDRSFIRAIALIEDDACEFSVDVQLKTLQSVEDDLLTQKIKAARGYVEHYQRRQLMEATYCLHFDRFPCGIIYPPIYPITSIEHIKYLDTSGEWQTIDEADYAFDEARIMPKTCWPRSYPLINAVEVKLKAGYATADDVPNRTKEALLMLADHFYCHREAVTEGALVEVPMGVNFLLDADSWQGIQ